MNYFYLIPYGQILDIREFMAAINFLCSKSWMRIWFNDVIFSKIPNGLKL